MSDICTFFFFSFLFLAFRDKFYCLYTVYHYSHTIHRTMVTLLKKNIKNGFHGTIYTFKNYFVTVFSVFSFQFQ